ncbi:MAG TPA: hypothetical protein DCO77_14650 [Nitrospiraceae bacterium]|nr:hypothetical protein [Nitrospiraceae bacterium]
MVRLVKKHMLLSIVLAFLFVPVYSNAGQLEDGSAALDKGQYKKAHALLLPLAKKGDAFAQYNLGVIYANGLGVTKNDAEAVTWYRKAAEQGDSDAQGNLGLMYENGRGVKQDYKKAMNWYQKSAKQGNVIGQNNIAGLYFNGRGVKKNDKKAIAWYRKAAKQGNALAQNSLGGMYVKGWGVKKDVNKGLEWIMKAAKQGLPDAQKNVFSIYYKDAKQGNPGAMHNVASMCFNGWIGKQDPQKCLVWYEKAATKGFEPSKKALVEIYVNGHFGIPANKKKARYWKQQRKSTGK